MALARSHVLRRIHCALHPTEAPLTFAGYEYNSSMGSEYAYRSTLVSPSTLFKITDCRPSLHQSVSRWMQAFPFHSYKLRSICSGSSIHSVDEVGMGTTGWNWKGSRSMSTMKLPAAAKQMSLKVTMLSPGFIYEPYAPREPISFLRRWFTRSGWKRTKEDIILEMKTAYAVSRLRKATGYNRKQFYQQAVELYKEINTLMANGGTSALRKLVTEKMYSTLKNEIKQRKSVWNSVFWEIVEPLDSIRTMRARMIALDKNDLNKSFIQLTLEFVSKQKYEAYDSKGVVIFGDKSKQVLVRDIWVFERSLFHPGAEWRVCGRIKLNE